MARDLQASHTRGMALERILVLLVVTAGAVGLIAAAPIAAADPTWPVAGAESAADTIRDLQDQGYNVAINWINRRSGDLSRCAVRAISNPDRSSTSPPPESTTVYVDVDCRHDDYVDSGSFGFGF
jgi:hypothetical protein